MTIPEGFEVDVKAWLQGRTKQELQKIDTGRFPHRSLIKKIEDDLMMKLIAAMRDKNNQVSQMLNKAKTDETSNRYKQERICILRCSSYIIRDYLDLALHEAFHEIETDVAVAITTLKKVKKLAKAGKKMVAADASDGEDLGVALFGDGAVASSASLSEDQRHHEAIQANDDAGNVHASLNADQPPHLS